MSPPLAYQPDRIQALRRLAEHALDELRQLRCDDSEALDAAASIRRVQRVLELDWMPLLAAIESSDAMVTWTASHRVGLFAIGHTKWLRFGGASNGEAPPWPYSDVSDDELLRHLELAGRFTPAAVVDSSGGLVAFDSIADMVRSDLTFWSTDFPDLCAELSWRVTADPAFADRAIAAVGTSPLIAAATRFAAFPTDFTVRALRAILQRPDWASGAVKASADAAAAQVVANGAGDALDVLSDREALRSILQPGLLDDSVTEALLVAGLHEAVVADPDRLIDGAEVLRTAVELTSGTFDAGISVGASRGLATTMIGWIDPIAEDVLYENDTQEVLMRDSAGNDLGPVGTYAALKDFFGAVMRDEQAQLTMGTVLSAYTDRVVASAGGEIRNGSAVQKIAHFGDLLRDAVVEEQVEMTAAAAAATARREQLGGFVGFSADALLTATGARAAFKFVAGEIADSALDRFSDVEADTMPSLPLGKVTYDSITLTVLERAIDHPSERVDLGVEGVSDEEWAELAHRIEDIDRAGPAERDGLISGLRKAASKIPQVDALLSDVHGKSGMETLLETPVCQVIGNPSVPT